MDALCKEEGVISDKLHSVIDSYLFTGARPLRKDVVSTLQEKPKILERKNITERIIEKIIGFVKTYDDDMGDV